MYVQCERCQTEYDFDDALVSERGTTVKCTHCGHQFRVRRSGAADPTLDKWIVRSSTGEVTYTALKELQRAILSKQVERGDILVRGNLPARTLGSIAELEPFFEGRALSKLPAPASPAAAAHAPIPPMRGAQSTLSMVSNRPPAPPLPVRARSIPAAGEVAVPRVGPPAQTRRVATLPDIGKPGRTTLRPPENGAAAAPPPTAATTKSSKSTLLGMPPDPNTAPRAKISSIPPPSTEAVDDSMLLEPLGATGESWEEVTREMDPAKYPPPAPTPAPTAPALPSPSASTTAPMMVTASSTAPMVNGAARAKQPSIPESPVARPRLPSIPESSLAGSEGPRPPPRRPSVPPPEEIRAAKARGEVGSVRPPPPTIEVETPLAPAVVSSRRPRAAMEDLEPAVGGKRVGGWVIAAAVVGGLVVFGATYGRQWLAPSPIAAVPALDSKAEGYLKDGEQALATGNLDVAKENFDKASVLVDKAPRLLVDLARLATARVDATWLRLRLLPDGSDEAAPLEAQLARLTSQAQSAAGDAAAASPDSPEVQRARIDAARAAGERGRARELVSSSKLASGSLAPETAYSLAMIDLTEKDPPFDLVTKRLTDAAAAEGGAGRARAALAYALALSGDQAGARRESERLTAQGNPVAPLLRSFVERAAARLELKADAGVIADVHALPPVPPAPPAGVPPPAGAAAATAPESAPVVTGDTRSLLSQAEGARAKGDYPKAKGLFEAALARNSADSEALSGLGDVARGQHDPAAAEGYYKRALAINPSYLPALLGIADSAWDAGDRTTAQKYYKTVLESFPEAQVPGRVKLRAEGASAAAAPTASAATTPTQTAPASTGGEVPATQWAQ